MALLTDTKARNTKASDKTQKLQDGQGLYLEVRPSGVKTWRYRYWIGEKDGIYTIGDYPGVTLAEARKAREWAREQAKLGLNPTRVKEAEKLARMSDHATTFEIVAGEWMEHSKVDWSADYALMIERTLESDVFPKLGKLPIKSVEAPHLLSVIRSVEKRGASTVAVLIRQWFGQIFRYAILESKATGDPSVALKGAIKRKPVRHNPPLSVAGIPEFLKKIEIHGGMPVTRIAIKLLMLTFLRTQELRLGEWSEVDLELAVWRVPADHMKMAKYMMPGEVHIVPLSRQAVGLLRDLHAITGHRTHLFPNARHPKECMSRTAINRVIERMGYAGEFSGHGFRTTASTMLHEMGFPTEVIDRQLAHAERNKVKATYNHAEYLPARIGMMQAWADRIDALSGRKDSEATAS